MSHHRSLVLIAALAVVMAACGDSAEPAASAILTAPPQVATTGSASQTTSPPRSDPSATTPAPPTTLPSLADLEVPPTLDGMPLARISVDHEVLAVALADTGGARRQGLMNVTDLRDLDGMLFVWTDDTAGGFWMRDTLLALDIAFFAADGSLVDTFPMEPCDLGSDCPTYNPAGAYRYALETEQGRLDPLSPDATLALPEDLTDN
jgi:uncharacterized membrane protein (UPF0127 family)